MYNATCGQCRLGRICGAPEQRRAETRQTQHKNATGVEDEMPNIPGSEHLAVIKVVGVGGGGSMP
ncbi:MAG: hypothetical protein ACLTDR_08500 [Adlercreutzia equolifaciens]